MEAADHELLRAAGNGDRVAFAELVQRYQRLVRWRLARLVPADQVDDLAQDVFVDLAKSLPSGTQPTSEKGPTGENWPADDGSQPIPSRAITSLAAWLVAVARRKAANFFRATQRYDHLLANYHERLGNSSVERLLLTEGTEPDESMQLDALAECLELLQPKYREIVDGYYAHGQSAEVLAVHTARTAGAIRMILMRIRRSLGKCISRRQESKSSGPNP